MNNINCVVFSCPPYPQYKEAPSDYSHSELFDCPKCKGKMWLSDKKKGLLLFASCLEKKIILGCYDCIMKLAQENPLLFAQSKKLNV